MSRSAVTQLLDHVRRLAGGSAPDDLLLADFLARRDESTFAALVARHGPMVLNLCRRILRDVHAAEDVFQATFLLLAERAASIRRRESLASWLHGVAYRLAVRAKRRHTANFVSERDVAVADDPAERLAWQEMLGVLDEELQRLSERYRAPLVLCYLEGLTQDEAARALGWSVGTLRRRLEQGRDRLHARLCGRGMSLPSALGGLLAAGTAAVPGRLQAATVAAALAAMKQGGGIMYFASVKTLLMLVASCGMAVSTVFWAYRSYEPRSAPAVAPVAGAADVDAAVTRAAEAVDECKEAVNWALLKELAVLEARRGNAALARKRFAQAADRVAGMSGYQRGIVLVMMAYGVASAGDASAATALLEEARRLARPLPPNNDHYEILRFAAACCAEKVSPAKALAWAKEIPDVVSRLNAFRNIAVAQADAGDVQAALRTVELIGPPIEHARLEPWEAIAAAQLKAGDRAGAQETLGKALALIKRNSADAFALDNEVKFLLRYAVAQAKAGDREAARETFQRVEKLLEPGAPPNSLTFLSSLARAQAQAGEMKAAARTVARCLKIKEEYGFDSVPLPLIVTQVLVGDYDGAVKFARGLTQPQQHFEVFQALAETGRQVRALAAAREVRSPEARAWGLLGVATGVLNRVSAERRPRYAAGTFALVIPHKPAPAAPKKEDTASAAETEMQNIIGEWERAWAEFNKRLDKAKSPEERQKMLLKERPSGDRCARELLALARKHRGQPIAFEALAWLVEFSQLTPAPAGPEAVSILLRDHLAEQRIGEVSSLAGTFLPNDPNTEKLIRATLANGPHRAARGEACLALADLLKGRAAHARLVQRRPAAGGEPAALKRLRSLDPAKLEAEAEKLYERVLAEFANLFPSRHGRPLGKVARAALDEIRLLAVGKLAPDIEGKDIDGKPLKLSEHRGKVVVLVFWAKWCGPCRAMIPHERALVKRLQGKPFVLLGVNGDGNRDELRKWLEKNPMPWRSWWDGDNGAGDGQGRIAKAWNVSSWPTVYVLDGRGVIRFKDVHDKELDDAVDSLLREGAKEAIR